MNHPGETAQLAAIARPTIGLINNAQREHQEFMKSVADVAREHADLLRALPGGGTAILNADDEFYPLWRDIARERNLNVREFGVGARGDRCAPALFAADSAGARRHGRGRLER